MCGANCFGKTGVTHHAAYKLPNGILVKTKELDMIGILLFPVCNTHHTALHTPRNWTSQGSHNTLVIFETLQKNWNKYVIHYQYKRNDSEQIWRGFFA